MHGQSEQKFGERLWYGGNLNLGFSGNTGTNTFALGIAPMVGYKIGGPFSLGPRVSLQYIHFRARLVNNQVSTANPITWGAGVFGRAKISRNIFAHAEYELAEEAFVRVDLNDIEVFRRQNGNTYIGAGYNSGNIWGYEIMALYNLTPPTDDLRAPFSIRFGFTYRF